MALGKFETKTLKGWIYWLVNKHWQRLMSVWCCLRSAVFFTMCHFGYRCGWGCGHYTLLSHQYFIWLQVCMTHTQSSSLHNSDVYWWLSDPMGGHQSVAFPLHVRQKTALKKKCGERGDRTINTEFRSDTGINEHKLECILFLPQKEGKKKCLYRCRRHIGQKLT